MRGGPHTSYLLSWVQDMAQDTTAPKVGFAALMGVVVELGQAFNAAFWIVALLWVADMVLGNLKAWTDPEVVWRLDKNLDGALRALVYMVLALVFQLVEQLLEIRGIDVAGLFVFGLYSLFALAEFRSIMGHARYFVGGLRKLYQQLVVLQGKSPGDDDAQG